MIVNFQVGNQRHQHVERVILVIGAMAIVVMDHLAIVRMRKTIRPT